MTSNPFDHSGIDDVIHGRLRLGVMAYLSTVNPALFGELREKTGATDGNLSVHLKRLEDAGYITQEKRFAGKKPQTWVYLTEAGIKAWSDWLARMAAIMKAAE